MHLTRIDILFWAMSFIEDVVLLSVMVLRGRFRVFPIFTSLVALNIMRTIVLFVIKKRVMNSILLIDSETVAATALQTTLSQFGFEVELAASGKAAHTWLRKAHFDLILVEFDLSPYPKASP